VQRKVNPGILSAQLGFFLKTVWRIDWASQHHLNDGRDSPRKRRSGSVSPILAIRERGVVDVSVSVNNARHGEHPLSFDAPAAGSPALSTHPGEFAVLYAYGAGDQSALMDPFYILNDQVQLAGPPGRSGQR
jgi:hypothetical protein